MGIDKMELDEYMTDGMSNLIENRPYLYLILETYIPRVKEVMEATELEPEIEIGIEIDDTKPKLGWTPYVRLVVDEDISGEEEMRIAGMIKQELDDAMKELEETNYKNKFLQQWSSRITYAIGTEEEFNG